MPWFGPERSLEDFFKHYSGTDRLCLGWNWDCVFIVISVVVLLYIHLALNEWMNEHMNEQVNELLSETSFYFLLACQMSGQQKTAAIKCKVCATSVLSAENYGATSGTQWLSMRIFTSLNNKQWKFIWDIKSVGFFL